MNLDHLRYFEVLAQLEHYGKASYQSAQSDLCGLADRAGIGRSAV